MARRPRLEFPGAIYHVVNRSNYRTWIYREPAAQNRWWKILNSRSVA
ncbi:MAG: hypothetical protein HY736_17210 [Verrucomicrobia bacterium]|nr:hypothetical protein [Verrucomicrobiota bacterium]